MWELTAGFELSECYRRAKLGCSFQAAFSIAEKGPRCPGTTRKRSKGTEGLTLLLSPGEGEPAEG